MSPILGGRREVLAAPFCELLAHLDMLKDKEKNERFGQFMNMFYANPMTNKQARQQYIKSIQPESELLKGAKRGKLATDLTQLKALKESQDREAAVAKIRGG